MLTTEHRRAKHTAYILIIIGIVGLIVSGLLYVNQPRPLIPLLVKSVAIDNAPSSTRPAAATIASYSVAPTLPKYIAIPAIDIGNTRIIQLGLTGSGQIATPDNIYDTGWYNGSVKPGQPGVMFIYGHVSSWTANGIFYNLKKLMPGENIVITQGDGQIYDYQVIETKVYPYNNVDTKAVLSPVNPNTPGLNLMTCTGQVIKGTSEFNERLVVFTSLVKN
jgi:sortase (surface protein transpeptidase)